MNIIVQCLFKPINDEDWRTMESLARSLTDHPKSIRVLADDQPQWLAVEFTMPTEAQYKVVDRIGRAIRLHVAKCQDSTISFPRTDAEIASAKRKAERRKARRRSP